MTYIGNKLKNASTILQVLFIFPLIVLISINLNSLLFFFVLSVFFYLVFSLDAYYFVLENDYLIVKNYMLPILKKKYSFSEIVNIEIVHVGKFSSSKACLQIHRKRKMYLGYPSASLKIKDWQEFIKELQRLGIKVSVDPLLQYYNIKK